MESAPWVTHGTSRNGADTENCRSVRMRRKKCQTEEAEFFSPTPPRAKWRNYSPVTQSWKPEAHL
jgi:hypothetical protein